MILMLVDQERRRRHILMISLALRKMMMMISAMVMRWMKNSPQVSEIDNPLSYFIPQCRTAWVCNNYCTVIWYAYRHLEQMETLMIVMVHTCKFVMHVSCRKLPLFIYCTVTALGFVS